jgi:hypothetical protein
VWRRPRYSKSGPRSPSLPLPVPTPHQQGAGEPASGPPEIDASMKELLASPGVQGFVLFNELGEGGGGRVSDKGGGWCVGAC